MDEYISREALLAEIAADYGNWIAYNDTDKGSVSYKKLKLIETAKSYLVERRMALLS